MLQPLVEILTNALRTFWILVPTNLDIVKFVSVGNCSLLINARMSYLVSNRLLIYIINSILKLMIEVCRYRRGLTSFIKYEQSMNKFYLF